VANSVSYFTPDINLTVGGLKLFFRGEFGGIHRNVFGETPWIKIGM
jgi:hypothetical protein